MKAGQADAKLPKSPATPTIASFLFVLGTLSLMAAVLFLAMGLFGNDRERGEGWLLFGCTLSGGLIYFALGKVVEYLSALVTANEAIVAALKLSTDRQGETIKALQWIIDNWRSRQ